MSLIQQALTYIDEQVARRTICCLVDIAREACFICKGETESGRPIIVLNSDRLVVAYRENRRRRMRYEDSR